MKKAIGYIRVSTSEQASEGISLDNQKAKISAYAALQDMELTEIIEDAGKMRIPEQSEPPFRRKPNPDSGASRTPGSVS